VRLHARPRRDQAGFTYLGLIIFVFIVGLVGAATLKVGALLQRAALENELLETGAPFSAALTSYARDTPRGQPAQPSSLQELLRDERFPSPRRHLRKIFVDPITGTAEWGIVTAGPGGRILGVHSLSQARPFKQANFDRRFPNFGSQERLSDWKFMAAAQDAVPVAPAIPVATPAPPREQAPAPLSGPETAPPDQPAADKASDDEGDEGEEGDQEQDQQDAPPIR
jgi:type II secretory pathway pseudopilin PulG